MNIVRELRALNNRSTQRSAFHSQFTLKSSQSLRAALLALFAVLNPAVAFADPFEVLFDFPTIAGETPVSSRVALASNGRFYGFAEFDPYTMSPMPYSVAKDGTEYRTLGMMNPMAGEVPFSQLVEGADGRLYGVAYGGGTSYPFGGTVFSIDPDGWNINVLHRFLGGEGVSPAAGLIRGADGVFYGTTKEGGLHGAGTVFAIGGDGTGYTVLRHLNSSTDGAHPMTRLMQGVDGRLYGTTYDGGPNGRGTLFALDTDGTDFSVIYDFVSLLGPNSGVVQGYDGRLYGTCRSGTYTKGTIYAIGTDGTGVTVLRHFNRPTDGGFGDIVLGPTRGMGDLVVGHDGRLFGNLPSGGANGGGTAYAIQPDGTGFKVLHAFGAGGDSGHPIGGLVQDGEGRLYGVTSSGGANDCGTLFAIDPIPDLAPWIDSPLIAGASYGRAFSYTITATRSPTEFDALNLPTGLSVDNTTGVISGAPLQTGVFAVTLAASNAFDTGYADLQLWVNRASAAVYIADTTFEFDGSPKSVTVTTTPSDLLTLVTYDGNSAPPSAVGSYEVVATIDEPNYYGTASATLTILPAGQPKIIQQPQDQTVTAGKNVTFSVGVSSPTSVNYQWLKDGVTISGATAATLRINKVKAVNAGVYSVVVTNAVGTVTSAGAALTVTAPPAITVQPVSATASPGESLTFTVAAAGSGPLSYQWRKNGTPISGATSATLILANIQTGDAGGYDVVVSNAYGSITSSTATLSVVVAAAPVITQQPRSVTVKAGRNVTFSVFVSSPSPVTYQWFKDGETLASATSSTLQLPKVTTAASGAYIVVVTNSSASVTSEPAILTVK
ncbi:MAG TPA: choice-of-anchor tandem repeat GloVer-containing protein [Opitutaceae bacterium]|nr:choice-of-anchor tandem repeat GloVer-containing protein [Opitutaceae bacterium]